MNKVKARKLCVLCESVDCAEHEPQFLYNGFECQLCLTVYSLNSEAQRCCLSMTDQSSVPESCLAPVRQKRDKGLEYPTEAIARKRGR